MMNFDALARKRIMTVFGVTLAAGLLPGAHLLSETALAQPPAPTSADSAAAPTSPQETANPPVGQRREEWERAMRQVPVPKKGCFTSSYPSLEWKEVQCTAAPKNPYPPASGHRPEIVGNSNDYAAEVTTPLISSVTGSYDSVTGVTAETGTTFGPNCSSPVPSVPNIYSLQVNTKPFTTSVCSASPNPACQGWQQFIYSNVGVAFIQYWLLGYNTTCPAGWNTYPDASRGGNDCWKNATNATSVSVQPVTNLASLKLGGDANAGGTDSVVVTTAGGTASAANNDSELNLASGWKGVEFITVGDSCSSQANFNAGSTIVVRTTVHNGTTNAPNCVMEGFTGETNNLNLVGTPAVGTGPSPAIVSKQSNVAGTMPSCANASGVGDTHLTTFGGLLYDFQATGDFMLAETDSNFLVQTRQVSGAPKWPNASINKAVAVQTGKSRVAICLAPTLINVDDKVVDLPEGKLLELGDGGDLVRKGNLYVVRGPSGDRMQATINSDYIDVSVGLGRWPSKVRGLLANAASGKVNEIEARDGTVLKSPFQFEVLYGRYGESWRVPPRESLLSPCGEKVERGIPNGSFFADNLDPQVAKSARAICTEAGVREGPLMDACTLDVAVIGRAAAASIYVGAANPIAIGDAR
jgi:hypothetical protein